MRSNLLAVITGFLTCVSVLLIIGALMLFKDYREQVHDMVGQLRRANEQIEHCRAALLATDRDMRRLEVMRERFETIEKRVIELSRLEALKAMSRQ